MVLGNGRGKFVCKSGECLFLFPGRTFRLLSNEDLYIHTTHFIFSVNQGSPNWIFKFWFLIVFWLKSFVKYLISVIALNRVQKSRVFSTLFVPNKQETILS